MIRLHTANWDFVVYSPKFAMEEPLNSSCFRLCDRDGSVFPNAHAVLFSNKL